MLDGANIVYVYDGSFDGLMCCVFESYVKKEIPTYIMREDATQATLFPLKYVDTDFEKAHRIYTSVAKKINTFAQQLITYAFLSANEDKEIAILRFILMGYKYGVKTIDMLTDDTVSDIHKMYKAVGNENHLLLGFVRFSEYNGALVAVIEPKHFVLPLMKSHFCNRYANEHFMIYDKTYGMALIYRPYQAEIIEIENLELPEEDETELKYRRLWKQYYDTIAIEERYNPKCRMTHMPKRFWKHITEMNNVDKLRISKPTEETKKIE